MNQENHTRLSTNEKIKKIINYFQYFPQNIGYSL